MYVNVLTQIGAKAVDKSYIYKVPNNLESKVKEGCRVKINFGKMILEGFITEILNDTTYDKTKIKEMIEDEEHPEEDFEKLLQEIAFSSQLNATHKDVVDSLYINQLLKAIQLNEAGAVEKFEKEIQQKDPQIQKMYHTLKDQLVNTTEEIDVAQLKETSIQNEIQRQLQKEAEEFGLSFDFLQSAMNEYQSDKKTIPYLTHLLDSMTLSKEEFEAKTGEKYRRRTKVLEERLQQNFEQLQKWKEEL